MTTLYDLIQKKLVEHKNVDSLSLSPSPVVNNILQVPAQAQKLVYISPKLSEPAYSNSNNLIHPSLASASSIKSLVLNAGSKNNSNICSDSISSSPTKINSSFDHSYVNIDIPDVDDLINACANINLNESSSKSSDNTINNLSQNQTFESATNDTTANEAQIELRLEESIQTFETCPVLELNQVFNEESLPTTVYRAPISKNQLSIIPYVSFEKSVLQKYQNQLEKLNSKENIDFKRSLGFFQFNETHSSLSEETNIVQNETSSIKNKFIIENNNTINFSLENIYKKKLESISVSVSVDATKENLNVNILKEESNQIYENEKLKILLSDFKTENELIAHEEISLNITQNIPQKIINETKEIPKKQLCVNNREFIIQENSSLSKKQDVTENKNTVDNSEIILKNRNNFINFDVFIQNGIKKLSNVDAIIKEEEILKHSNKVFTEKIQNLKSVSKTEELEENSSKVAILEFTNKKESKLCVKDKLNTISKQDVFIQKEIENINANERFLFEESCKLNALNSEITASNPLHLKNFLTEDMKESSNRKYIFSAKSEFSRNVNEQKIIKNLNSLIKREVIEELGNDINFDETVAINKSFEKSCNSDFMVPINNLQVSNKFLHENSLNQSPQESEYEAFKPQQQSTNLTFPDQCKFRVFQKTALSIAQNIDESLGKIEESEHFTSATTELFEDPSVLDFLNHVGSQTIRRDERYDSLYMKFDPLAETESMFPQKNIPVSLLNNEEVKEIKVETPISNQETPKKSPALAAIDRLLFYSPCTVSLTNTSIKETKQTKEMTEQESQLVPIINETTAKELEVVRSTVIQLENELEKQKQEHIEQLQKQKDIFDNKITHIQMKFNQIQSQLTQEIKCKDQMTVVMEEYEKSISRLISEREKDRTNFEKEKIKIQEELQVANQHLSNTEAAFSDVHLKYERLKNVVSAYKSNETVLKESIAENQETIKTLENRYEQLKSHAMAQLEKANLELNAIRKQNEAETVKLKALVRKAELKSKSLEETVEQKMKENKELTHIIDEMIARVD